MPDDRLSDREREELMNSSNLSDAEAFDILGAQAGSVPKLNYGPVTSSYPSKISTAANRQSASLALSKINTALIALHDAATDLSAVSSASSAVTAIEQSASLLSNVVTSLQKFLQG